LSTGPKTAAGKARAAQNAFRHGLNVSVLSDPLLAPEVEAMARKICGPDADAETLEWARRIAEAQIDLNRVRTSRRRLLTRFFVDPYYQPKHVNRLELRLLKMALSGRLPPGVPADVDAIKQMVNPKPPEGEEKLAIIIKERVSELAVFDRYERRALSRRKAAIRNFQAARLRARPRPTENKVRTSKSPVSPDAV
jgi:hypothetical protein